MAALATFLGDMRQPVFFDKPFTLFMKLPEESSVFFPLFISQLKRISPCTVELLNLEQFSFDQIQVKFETSFLGQASCFVMYADAAKAGGFDDRLWRYLATYSGMHYLCVAVSEFPRGKGNDRIRKVSIEESIDRITYRKLYAFIYQSHSEQGQEIHAQWIDRLFRSTAAVPLDIACAIMPYQSVVGKNVEQFFREWYHRIVPAKHSLFVLSQHLFAQDHKLFYQEWSHMCDEYPQEFWVVFLSEQLWQASMFLSLAQTAGALAAKKVATRLPFSFIQRDWRKHSVERLVNAFDQLYAIDFAGKNGVISDGLDLVYAKILRKE
jgi:hypothetical protein